MTKTVCMKVLIVDGSKQKRHDLVEALAELTNVVVQGAVSHVRTALSAVADASPDVIVTGVVLPDGEGTHLIERVRRMATPPSIVVVADPGSEEQRERYLAAGADRYVIGEDVAAIQAAVVDMRNHNTGVSAIQSQRLFGRMTAGVVHDLNNYLSVLDGSLELLNRHPEDRHELWPPIRSMVDSIQDLIGNLLAYARGGSPPMEALDLGEVVREALVIGRRMIPTNVIQTLEIADGLRHVHGVRAELQQMVLNLIINACDAMPCGGALHIAVKGATPRAVMLEISDSGTGKPMPPASGRTSSTKVGRNGVGLGLGIVQSVITHHHGALRILERTGGGTLVAVMLPTVGGN